MLQSACFPSRLPRQSSSNEGEVPVLRTVVCPYDAPRACAVLPAAGVAVFLFHRAVLFRMRRPATHVCLKRFAN